MQCMHSMHDMTSNACACTACTAQHDNNKSFPLEKTFVGVRGGLRRSTRSIGGGHPRVHGGGSFYGAPLTLFNVSRFVSPYNVYHITLYIPHTVYYIRFSISMVGGG
jgi:hypothetical protein